MNGTCQRTKRPLALERLEDRTLMSTCHVTRLTDMGAGKGFRGDLRYCINKVNTEPGPDVIDFTVMGTINLESALPDVDSDVEIRGPGVGLLTIDAKQKTTVLYVEEDITVTISGVTLTGGMPQSDQKGGAIYNEGGLFLEDCAVTANTGKGYGGGIYNDGTLWISNCTVTDNFVAIGGGGGYYTRGGGIYNSVAGTLFVHDSVISDNANQPGYSYVAIGAGIANEGNATVVGSTISWNLANPASYGTIGGCGGGIFNSGTLLVDSSAIAMNTASGDYWAYGGGICNGYRNVLPAGAVTVNNSTLAYNWAFVTGFDDYDAPRGGAISSENGGSISIDHSTIAGNHSSGGWSGFGGGIWLDPASTTLSMRNTILAGNGADTGPDLSGNLVNSGNNLFGKTVGGSGYHATDLLDVNPTLGPLQYNGGPTQTMALLSGSPAIDAGDNANAPAWDQRGPGFPRIINGTIDIGAFEVQATTIPPSPVYGAFREAVLGPPFTTGYTPIRRATATPFTGFLDVRLEPGDVSPVTRRQRRAYYRCAESPVNGAVLHTADAVQRNYDAHEMMRLVGGVIEIKII